MNSSRTRKNNNIRRIQVFGVLLLAVVALWPGAMLAADCSIGENDIFCASCEVGDRCVTDGTERGTCQVVPEGTEDSTVSEGVVIRAGNKICTNNGTTPAMLPSSGDGDGGGSGNAPSTPIGPTFAVNIPTVQITGTQTSQTEDGEYYQVDIPWIADYITGVYRYAVFFGSVLAAVLFMLAGLQWLTAGGNASRVGAAKKRMVDTTIGLVLILGTFLILNTVNPELTSLRPLRVKTVPLDPLEVEMHSTTVATSVPGDSTYDVRSDSGTYVAQYFNDCPFDLPESLNTPPNCEGRNTFAHPTCRERVFFERIYPMLEGDTSQKYVMAMEAAWKCRVKLGSCGRTLSDLAELALSGPNAECLQQENRGRFPIGCMDTYRSRAQNTTVRGWNEREGKTSAEILDILRTENPGYPDNLNIGPGAIVTYYNGNPSAGGSHRVFVAGFNEETGMAQLLEGQVGSPPTSRDVCMSSVCRRYPPIGIVSYLR